MKRQKIVTVSVYQESGKFLFYCDNCQTNLKDLIEKNFSDLIQALLKRRKHFKKCPNCQKKLNWENIFIQIQFVPIK